MERGRVKDPLIPPVWAIYDRLTKNQRERRRLRTLLKLARESAADTGEQPTPEAADGREGGQ